LTIAKLSMLHDATHAQVREAITRTPALEGVIGEPRLLRVESGYGIKKPPGIPASSVASSAWCAFARARR